MTQEATPVGGETTAPTESTEDVYARVGAEVFGDEPDEPEEGSSEPTEDDIEQEEGVDDTPPIDAPVSWDAEAKAKFAELPRDVQEVVARRETERERFVQQKSQEAAKARQEVEATAYQQLAQYDAQVAQQLSQYAEQLAPQRPNPALLQHDPSAFYAQQANYEAMVAQQQQLQQQAQGFMQQAQVRAAQMAQAEQAEQHRIIVENFPEYADPTTGPELRSKLTTVAKRLGYPDQLISQARASDIIAMREVASALEKADKYDALMSKKMSNVRAAGNMPPVARPGVSQGGAQVRARSAQAALDTALSSKDRNVQGEAFYQYLEKTGQVK